MIEFFDHPRGISRTRPFEPKYLFPGNDLASRWGILYNRAMQNDTIAAIATPPGIGGIGVVRVSGTDAFTLVEPLFRQPGGRTGLPPSHLLAYGHIVDPATGEIIDEVLVAFMNAPRTYTSENVVEIQGHGGPLVLQRILRLVLARGARMANAGEFTLRAFLNGRLYRQGLRTAIIGRPNVGKSSLLNALLRSERAIVTPIAGTTRDTVEEVANLRGIPLHLIDTAGITPTDDPIEQMGVQRSRAAAESADVVLLVFDGAEKLTEQDYLVSRELQAMGFGVGEPASIVGARNVGARVVGEGGVGPCGCPGGVGTLARRPVITVVNKVDRPQVLEVDQVCNLWPGAPLVRTSTLTGSGLSDLEETIAELVLAGKALQRDSVLVTSARHQDALRRAAQHLQASLATLEQGLPLDFVSIDLRTAFDALGEVTGEAVSEDLLDRIFSEFCIGK